MNARSRPRTVAMVSPRRLAQRLAQAVGLLGVLTMVLPVAAMPVVRADQLQPTRKRAILSARAPALVGQVSPQAGGTPATPGSGPRRTATAQRSASAPRRAPRTEAAPRASAGSVHRAASASAVQPGAALPDPWEQLFSPEAPLRRARPADDEKPIGTLTTNIIASRGELPANYAAARFDKEGTQFHIVGTSRPWMELVYDWEATSFCHGPLYFEEPNAERLGHTAGLAQPVVSGAHFFARIPALPYMIAAEPPLFTCTYTLGHYRPGSYAPFRYIRLPLSISGAVAQTGVVMGLVYLIP